MSETTLLIKNLPHCLHDAEKNDFLKHFGAQEVKIIHSNVKKNNLAFAIFRSKEEADLALKRLHNFSVLGYTLSAVYAKKSLGANPEDLVEQQNTSRRDFNSFLNKFHAFNESVGFMQPAPPHIKYCYPAPTKATLMNILRALETVPKFYTQVLHLMNKMNLHPPFCEDSTLDSTFLESNIYDVPRECNISSVPNLPSEPEVQSVVQMSSEESELESDPDEKKLKEIVPEKRAMSQKKQPAMKRLKLSKIESAFVLKPNKSKISAEEAFEEKRELEHTQKKIELKLSTTQIGQKNNEELQIAEVGTFGKIYPNKIPENTELENSMEEYRSVKEPDCITNEQLASNRISEKDFHLLPAFKNYKAGEPSSRIYIKNLAKDVIEEDICFIYKKYIDLEKEDEESGPNMFNVRLMQEGRMKGQAFVTFQNIEQAQKALNETNGYILKSRPMAVVFARSASAKPK